MPAQRIFRRSPLVLSTASARAQAESPPPRPARSHRRLRQGCLRPSWFNQNTTTQTIPLFLTFSTFSGSTPAHIRLLPPTHILPSSSWSMGTPF